MWVEHQGKSYATEAIGHDRVTNVSVLRVLELPEEFAIITLDTNAAQPRLGAIAIGITCPLDFEPSPSTPHCKARPIAHVIALRRHVQRERRKNTQREDLLAGRWRV